MNQDKLFFLALVKLVRKRGQASALLSVTLFFCYLISKFLQLPLTKDNFPKLLESCPFQTRIKLLKALNSADEALLIEIILTLKSHKDAPILSSAIDHALHHFYPNFLREYNKDQWKETGTFYTASEIVRFMLLQINHFWQEEHVYNLGNAPPETVRILDPAVGSGVFLKCCIEEIRKQKKCDWSSLPQEEQQRRWKNYLSAPKTGLLYRMMGIELDPLALLIAELRLGWLLCSDSEYPFYFSEEDHFQLQQADSLTLSSLAFSPTIILGNPPYNSSSKQVNKWISSKIEDYKYVNGQHFEEKKHWLSDDYIKFIRFAHHHLQSQKQGVLSFITPNAFLSAPSFRAMRWNLLQDFSFFQILDLQGNHHQAKNDQNLFDIQQGLTTFLFGISKRTPRAQVLSATISGTKISKLQILRDPSFVSWKKHIPKPPFYSFLPLQDSETYANGFSLTDFFIQYSTGLQTGDEKRLTADSPEELQNRFSLKTQDNIIPYLHKPFQIRYLLYAPSAQKSQLSSILFPKSYRIREKTSKHMLEGNNIALLFARSNKSRTIDHFFISSYCSDLKSTERTTGSVFAPLYLRRENGSEKTQTANLNPVIVDKISAIIGQQSDPISSLDYVYAILYSRKYRNTNKSLLSIDYPRIPYPRDKKQFHALVALGRQLRLYHLQKHPSLEETLNRFSDSGSHWITTIRQKEEKLFINDERYFFPVSKEVFHFQIGGYPVVKTWLKAHLNQKLSPSNMQQLNQMLFILEQTIQLMDNIDQIT